MQKRILKFMEEHQMLEQGDRIILGVSAGADSVCMLRVLCALRESYALKLLVVHVNHGLRGKEAMRDEQFTLELCKELKVPCEVVRGDVRHMAKELHLSEEEAGRELRYQAFARTARSHQYNKIAVAHHMGDNAETVLFRIFRGTGISGLAGMAPVSVTEDGLTLLRPLLCVSRAMIEEYLQILNQAYCVDSTNNEDIYSRNRIRNRILPMASEYINVQSERNINALSQHARRISDYLTRQADAFYQSCVQPESDRFTLTLTGTEEPVLIELVFRHALYDMAGKQKDISAVHIAALLALSYKQVGSRVNLPYGLLAIKTYQGIELRRQEETSVQDKAMRQEGTVYGRIPPGEQEVDTTVLLPGEYGSLHFSLEKRSMMEACAYDKMLEIARNDYTKCFDYDKIKDNILVRMPKTTDYLPIYPDGRKKSLKDYLVDSKVPQERRSSLCLIAEGDSILWIPGMRTGEHRRVTKETKTVLLIEWMI